MLKTRLLGMAAALALAQTSAHASTMYFNNNSGSYSADGVTATVSVTTSSAGGGLYYNNVEDAIGVGSNNINGAMGFKSLIFVVPTFTTDETMTVSFDREVTVDTVFFRQWENSVGGFGDLVQFDYSGGTSGSGSLLFSDSGIGDGLGQLLDPFAAGISLTSFTITPFQDGNKLNGANAKTAVYLHSLDFNVTEVPVPAAAWLFGSALLGLAGFRRQS